MISLTFDQIIETRKKLGYPCFGLNKDPYNIMITGIRNIDNKADTFDDFISLAYYDENHVPIVKVFEATTDPGKRMRINPTYPEQIANGVAILKEGHYPSSHCLGYHGYGAYRHEALVQCGNLTIYRDNDRDEVLDWNSESKIQTGSWFGINIHRAHAKHISSIVDNWSAGCQVVVDPEDFKEFMALCVKSSRIYGSRFSYTLINIKDVIQ